MRQQRVRKQEQRKGAALVEMALVLPVFLTIVLGIMEFGRAMTVTNLLANASREGARLAVTTGTTNTEVSTAVKSFMNQALGVATSDVNVTITVTAAAGNPNPNNDVALAKKKDLCAVHVTLPFDKVSLVAADYLTGASLVGHSAMRHE
jgi:Flp pilus assembly protein TadG